MSQSNSFILKDWPIIQYAININFQNFFTVNWHVKKFSLQVHLVVLVKTFHFVVESFALITASWIRIFCPTTAWKLSKDIFLCPCFPIFELNAEKGKIGTRKFPCLDTFHAGVLLEIVKVPERWFREKCIAKSIQLKDVLVSQCVFKMVCLCEKYSKWDTQIEDILLNFDIKLCSLHLKKVAGKSRSSFLVLFIVMLFCLQWMKAIQLATVKEFDIVLQNPLECIALRDSRKTLNEQQK